MSTPRLTVPGHPPHSHSQGAWLQWPLGPLSHLSDEGVPDFPVIPFSRPEAFTYCSLFPIVALAWAWGQITYDQWGPGTCGLNPKACMTLSQSLRYLQPKDRCHNSGTAHPARSSRCPLSDPVLAWAPYGAMCPCHKGA